MLQGMSWCEKHRPADLASRNAYLSSEGKAIAEPLFCFETAFKLLALSRAAYAEDATPVGWETTCALPGTLQEAQDQHATDGCPRSPAEDSKCKCYCSSPTCREDQMEKGSVHNDKLKTSEGKPSTSELTGALAMLGLEHAHVIHEADPDTKVVIGWRAGIIVICFRGTASMKNVLHDLQTWRADHPPKRGLKCMGTRPMVHKGFWRSWSSHGVRGRVFDTVAQIMAAQGRLTKSMEVLLTGKHYLLCSS
ncbi:g10851 [Coccomyxa viridis]|uniref:G10851 protein n=1 Tax=Coccomyxa viridis TaxID=1274662 RepID=A0ABP1GAY1_9CHLO